MAALEKKKKKRVVCVCVCVCVFVFYVRTTYETGDSAGRARLAAPAAAGNRIPCSGPVAPGPQSGTGRVERRPPVHLANLHTYGPPEGGPVTVLRFCSSKSKYK